MSGTVEIKLWFQPSIADHISGVCEQIRNCCFCCTADTLTFPDSSCFQRNFFHFFLPLWQHMHELDLARQPYMASQWLADRWYSSGWHMKIYGFQFVLLKVLLPPLLFWIWLETLGAHFKDSRRLLSGDRACDTRKWMYTIGIRWICLSTQRKCRQFMLAFCPSCLFFHFVISSLP